MQNEMMVSSNTPQSELREIDVTHLKRGQYQPRHDFSEEGLKSLAETIKRLGVLEPILVRKSSLEGFEIIAGERRWRAAQLAGLKTVPCLIGNYGDEKASQIALIENLNREDLNPIDEARGISNAVEEFGYTHQEIASILGKGRSHITNLLRLLRLDQRVQEMMTSRKLSEAHGKILAGVPPDKQFYLATHCIEKQWSTRDLMKEMEAIENPLGKAKKGKNKNKMLGQKTKDANILRLEREVTDNFGHETTFSLEKNNAGYVNIRFFNLDDLEVILEKIKLRGKIQNNDSKEASN